VIAVICPGQGAQAPGLLRPWLELAGFAERIERYSDVSGLDLVRLGTTGSADEIRDTMVAQVLIVATGIAVAAELDQVVGPVRPTAVAGHSVGEFTAAAVAGALQPDDAVGLVTVRGRAMADAAARAETGMSAVVGGRTEDVLARIFRHGLTPANVNGAGQIVAAGPIAKLDRLSADPPAAARVVPLRVAGAFHTDAMAPALPRCATVMQRVRPREPQMPLLSNADGRPLTAGTLLPHLLAQICRPVRWDLCMSELHTRGVHQIVELSPAGTLSGLVRRALPGLEVVPLRTPDDLNQVRAALDHEAA
jgi:[acyl-carrier-protein] S-malonyltransferase